MLANSRRHGARQANLTEAELERLNRVKRQQIEPATALGPCLLEFFRTKVQKRQDKLSRIAQRWTLLVPQPLLEHCCLESFNAGTLKVVVDSSSHLYELKQLLLAGLEDQILLACRSCGLRRITLKPGRWYEGQGGNRKIRF